MMENTRIFTALRGIRGHLALDLPALEQLLVRFADLVVTQRIKEMDQSASATPKGFMALDVRLILHAPEVADADLTRPTITPYPIHHVCKWRMRDGTSVLVRPIRPEDEPLVVDFHQQLSHRSVHQRWFNAFGLDQRTAHERLARLCFIDYDREMALVVEHAYARTGRKEIIAVDRLSRLHDLKSAEFALAIVDAWQKRGPGTELLKRLVKIAREQGLYRIFADILPDNLAMRAVARKLGLTFAPNLAKGAAMQSWRFEFPRSGGALP